MNTPTLPTSTFKDIQGRTLKEGNYILRSLGNQSMIAMIMDLSDSSVQLLRINDFSLNRLKEKREVPMLAVTIENPHSTGFNYSVTKISRNVALGKYNKPHIHKRLQNLNNIRITTF